MGDTGLEQSHESAGKTGAHAPGRAESGAVGARLAPSDPALAAVVEAWPTLSDAVKTGILALLKAHGGKEENP